MYDVDKKYKDQFDAIKAEILASEELTVYLDSEEEEAFLALREAFEPKIDELFKEIATQDPLQLENFEKLLLDEELEGLYLTRILGYSVLRGEKNDKFKYAKPQDHFKDILLTICSSSNFDFLKKRIGQTIQVGFALSSDIWITNLINSMNNKKVRYFLQNQKLPKYRIQLEREIGFNRYKKQFASITYTTTVFPTTVDEMIINFKAVKNFLLERIPLDKDNESLLQPIVDMLKLKELQSLPEYVELLIIYLRHYSHLSDHKKEVLAIIHELRKTEEFEDQFFEKVYSLVGSSKITWDPDFETRLYADLHEGPNDTISEFVSLVATVQEYGFIDQNAMDKVRNFYNTHEGVSIENSCVRQFINNYFRLFINDLDTREYAEWFDISKYYSPYMGIFSNEKYNKKLKELNIKYLKKLTRVFTDKRGRDYQDVKKFVMGNFGEWGFMKDKEMVEFFKTKRKKVTKA